jgi:hypothetical protein
MPRLSRTTLALALTLTIAPQLRAQSASWNFETTPVNTPTPLSITNNGVTATFSGPATGVCDVSPLNFVSLSGRALIQNLCITGPATTLQASFSSALSQLGFGIATSSPGSVTLQAFLGATLVSTISVTTVVPPNRFFAEALVSVAPASAFDRLVLNPGTSAMAIDNLVATVSPAVIPEPSAVVLLATGLGALGVAARRKARQLDA